MASRSRSPRPRKFGNGEHGRNTWNHGTDDPGKHSDDYLDDIGDVAADPPFIYGTQIKVDEDQENEFKEVGIARNPIDRIADYCTKYICAFLNTNGGKIYFGIRDDGTILGIPFYRADRDKLRLKLDSVLGKIRPQVDPHLVHVKFVRVHEPESRRRREAKHFAPRHTRSRPPARWDSTRPRRHMRVEEGDDYSGEEDDDDEEAPLFVVVVEVGRGRAPVYMVSKGGLYQAFYRLSGSVAVMEEAMIEERKRHGRPVHAEGPLRSPRDFIGRDAELGAIRAFVDRELHPPVGGATAVPRALCCVLYGPPASGKSALAQRLVAEFSSQFMDRTFVIDMKGVLQSRETLVDAMLSVVRVVHPSLALKNASENEIRGVYDSCFSQRRCILLVENASTAEQVRALVPMSAAACLIIVTSRRDLQLDTTAALPTLSIRLGALSPQDAVALLRALVPSLSEPQAQELAQASGYMPFALRLLGNTLRRRPNLTPDILLRRLREGFVRGSAIEFLAEASLEAWFGVYSNEVQEHLLPLSVTCGTFDATAAAALYGESYEQTLDNLGLLLEEGLLDFDETSQTYTMNELLRKLAARELAKDREKLNTYRARFIKHYLVVLHKARLMVSATEGAERERGAMLFERERKNIETCLALARELRDFKLIWQLAHELTLLQHHLSKDECVLWNAPITQLLEMTAVQGSGELPNSPSPPQLVPEVAQETTNK